MFVRTILIAMAGVGMFGAQPATAAGQDPWEAPLRRQLQHEQRCELGYVTNLRVDVADGRQIVTGRAHCRDGRAFEVARTSSLQPFAMQQSLIEAEA